MAPSIQLREWLRKELLIELWETRPRVTEKKLEDESIVKEVVLNSEGRPVIDKKLRGVR